MTNDVLLALATFSFVSSITPGPNNLMLMTSGTNFGLARSIPHMLGVALGFVAMLGLIGAGLTRIFDLVPGSYLALKLISSAYLLYLAWKIATASTSKTASSIAEAGKPFSFVQAVLFQWVNPKAWTMAITAVSAYTFADRPIASLGLVMVVFGLINLPCILTWTVLGTQIRRLLGDPVKLRIFNLIAAFLLVATIWPILAPTLTSFH